MSAERHSLTAVKQSVKLLKAALSCPSCYEGTETSSWLPRACVLEGLPIGIQVDCNLSHLIVAKVKLSRSDSILKKLAVKLVLLINFVINVI